MARKSPEESARTRAAILDSGLAVFAEKGYSRSTLNDIAKQAGFTRGAVYWHFKDKADLFTSLTADIGKPADELFYNAAPTSAVEFSELFNSYFALFDTDSRYRKFYEVIWFYTEWSEELSPVLAIFREEMRRLSDWLVSVFGQFQDSDRLAAMTTPQLAAIATCSLLEGLISLRLSDSQQFPTPNELDKLLRHFFTAFITDCLAGAEQ
jgi:TetR/AcrR family transcriptional regulator, acrAB operon repressor